MSQVFKLLGVILIIFVLVLPVVGCAQEFRVFFCEPRNGATVTEPQITIEGKVTDAKAIVMVNGTPASVTSKGIVSVEVTLTEGENTLEAVATRGKKVTTKTITVTYSPSG